MGMFIMHIALQGCLRAQNVPYGLTPDTGGHIKYLLELVAAIEAQDKAIKQQIILRRFTCDKLGAHYGAASERISDRARIIRIRGATDAYLPKETLRFELPALADNLEAHLRALPRRPDIIHAHYADAGKLALEIKQRLDIPFIFTAHSLGRVKSAACAPDLIDSALRARIEMEEEVIAKAERIVTSSMDEAELQYGLYRAAKPQNILVNPPGCDLGAFSKPSPARAVLAEARDKFLSNPEKPMILALARPVKKKNLAGLVRAYGQSPALQEAANLVIYAGTRGMIEEEDEEPCAVLTELLRLVDDYDLWGKAALPKSHAQSDVPAIYQAARDSGGVFVNAAFNEPFGLTFLEAAASGLPVIATNSGGPNDILARCKNGRLVVPNDNEAIGAAILALLEDKQEWRRAAQNGLESCGFYSWARHASQYLRDVEWVAAQGGRPRAFAPPNRYARMLVCDIDNTLTGDRAALDRLRHWLTLNPTTAFGIATGRSLHSAIDIIREWNIPAPLFLITSVGSEVYWAHDPLLRALGRDEEWPPLGRGVWRPQDIEKAMKSFGWVKAQPAREQRRFKRSYFLRDSEKCAKIRDLLTAKGLEFELIYSHGKFLDLLPRGVSKGHAIHHVAQGLGVAPGDIWAAGDSGNDAHMLKMVGHPIIVGNHTPELAHLKAKPLSYFAKGDYAAGVMEGLLQTASETAAHEN